MSTNRNVQAKNRAPASIQITAEQILREAKDRQLDVEVKAPRQQITDAEELRVFRMRKRKEVCGGVVGVKRWIAVGCGPWLLRSLVWVKIEILNTRLLPKDNV